MGGRRDGDRTEYERRETKEGLKKRDGIGRKGKEKGGVAE